MINTILLPLFGPDDGRSLALSVDLSRHFRAHLEIISAPAAISMDEQTFERWRVSQGLKSQRHRGLPSASLSPILELSRDLQSRAKLSDLICIAGSQCTDLVEDSVGSLVFACGRPVLIVPMPDAGPYVPNSFLGTRAVIGWNGSSEAVRAISAALPFLEVSTSVEVLTLDEEAYGAADAYEVVTHLSAHDIIATAAGIGRKDWVGKDIIDIAGDRRPGLFVMGARRQASSLGSATKHYLTSKPFPALIMA